MIHAAPAAAMDPGVPETGLSPGWSGAVCLLHDYREEDHVSMRLYAEHLGDALLGLGVPVQHLRVPGILAPRWRGSWLPDRLDSYLGRFAAYPRALRHTDAEIYHVVDHGQGHLLRHLDPRRTVVTCHDAILLAQSAGRVSLGRIPVVATQVLRHALSCLRRAARIIAVSHQTRRDLVSLVDIDPDKVQVIYSGLNGAFGPDEEAGNRTRHRLGLESTPVILHVGHSRPYKNIEACLRVLGGIRREGVMATLVHAGQGLTPRQRDLAVSLGVENAVLDLGPVDDEELRALYNAANVFLFPSHYEGFGWPPLEAMASGTPVVCSSGGALREVVGEAALVAQADDTDGLTARVAAVLSDPSLADSLRERGLGRARLFDWRRTAAGVRRVYESVLREAA